MRSPVAACLSRAVPQRPLAWSAKPSHKPPGRRTRSSSAYSAAARPCSRRRRPPSEPRTSSSSYPGPSTSRNWHASSNRRTAPVRRRRSRWCDWPRPVSGCVGRLRPTEKPEATNLRRNLRHVSREGPSSERAMPRDAWAYRCSVTPDTQRAASRRRSVRWTVSFRTSSTSATVHPLLRSPPPTLAGGPSSSSSASAMRSANDTPLGRPARTQRRWNVNAISSAAKSETSG